MQHKDFKISSIVDEAIGLKLNEHLFEDLLNEKLQLKDYGEDIHQLFCTFLAVSVTILGPCRNCPNLAVLEIFLDIP